jgi:hypothetical protein
MGGRINYLIIDSFNNMEAALLLNHLLKSCWGLDHGSLQSRGLSECKFLPVLAKLRSSELQRYEVKLRRTHIIVCENIIKEVHV